MFLLPWNPKKKSFCTLFVATANRVIEAWEMLISYRELSSIYQHLVSLSMCVGCVQHWTPTKTYAVRTNFAAHPVLPTSGEWWTQVFRLHHRFDYTCLRKCNKRANIEIVVWLKLSLRTRVLPFFSGYSFEVSRRSCFKLLSRNFNGKGLLKRLIQHK